MNKPLAARLVLPLFFALGIFSFLPAQAQQLVETLGQWEITEAFDEEGNFEVCLATKTYDNGEAVVFYAHRNFLAVGLLLERWALDSRDNYEVALQFDNLQRWPAKALRGIDNQSVLIDWDFTAEAENIRTSSTLTIHTAAGSLQFDLAGLKPALDRVLECKQSNLATPAN